MVELPKSDRFASKIMPCISLKVSLLTMAPPIIPLCAFLVVVAGSDSDSQALGPSSGIAGFGQTGVQTPDQTLVGQYLTGHTDISSIQFGLALNPLSDPNAGSDSSGGELHIFQPDTSFYTGNMATLPVANANQQSNFGSVPTQLGSYDWTVQLQGWSFTPGQNQQAITGGGGVYTTVEASYPYIVLTAEDAQRICTFNLVFAPVLHPQPLANLSLMNQIMRSLELSHTPSRPTR